MRAIVERGAHLGGLWAVAVAQPFFELAQRSEVLRGQSDAQLVAFALLVALAPPVALVAVEALLGLVSERLARWLHLGLVTILVAAVALQALSIESAAAALVLALALGVVAAIAYARLAPARSALSVLAPAPVVLLALFLAFSGHSQLGAADVRAADAPRGPPVVLVILDELPVHSLMDARGMVDRRLFPSFARLARDATWYRNTTSVSQDTPFAVPAILDGRLPARGLLPVAEDHPDNLFTLLGGRYELHVQEEATALCPPRLCGERRSPWGDLGAAYLRMVAPDELDAHLPKLPSGWDGAGPSVAERTRRLLDNLGHGRPDRFRRFVAAIRGGRSPRLHAVHVLLPHVPYQYLPSGRAYRADPHEQIAGLNTRRGWHSRFLTEQAYQRHLLQLGATDRLLGELLDRLERVGIYDRALVAVVADHGVSFRTGQGRRLLRPGNVRDIAPVPFFLKRPGQRRGQISDEPLQTIDVLPTIADALGIRVPWFVDGRSALERVSPAARPQRRIWRKAFSASYSVGSRAFPEPLRRKERLFGDGLLRFGPRPQLLGQAVTQRPISPATGSPARRPRARPRAPAGTRGRSRPASSSDPRARLVAPERFADVDPRGPIVPVHVAGTIEGGRRGGGRQVAVAVNGRIEATGVTFTLEGERAERFSLMVPERALRRGRNRIELLWLRRRGVQPLGGTRSPARAPRTVGAPIPSSSRGEGA